MGSNQRIPMRDLDPYWGGVRRFWRGGAFRVPVDLPRASFFVEGPHLRAASESLGATVAL
jgi:hypothetical protein